LKIAAAASTLAFATQTNLMADNIKLAVAALILVAAGAGFYLLSTSPLVVRIGVLLVGAVITAAVAWTTEPGKRFYAYAQESVTETKKVVWPSRKETVQTTGVVVAFVLVMALFLWVVDASLAWVVNMLVRREG
jgi:preprotein translocase subunit SecE